MENGRNDLPLDARLLSDAVIEFNISRRNVAIYPKGHPSVMHSLDAAFGFLAKLFELRPEITLGVARDTLIIDESYLDKHNPVYRDFATTLSGLGVAYVTFIQGVQRDEIYAFQKLLCITPSDRTREEVDEYLADRKLHHIRVGFVDYDAFVFRKKEDGAAGVEVGGPEGIRGEEKNLWERYVYGLMNDELLPPGAAETIRSIPAKALATLMNETATEQFKEGSYDQVITNYMQRTAKRAFSPGDMKKILAFIDNLKPELKKEFLASTVKQVSMNAATTERALRDVSAEEVIELLTLISEQRVAIPETLQNLLTKFASYEVVSFQTQTVENNLVVDDMFLSQAVLNLLEAGNFEEYVSKTYQREILTLLETDAARFRGSLPQGSLAQCTDEFFEFCYGEIVLELLLAGTLEEDDYGAHLRALRDVALELLNTGQYLEIVKILTVLDRSAVRSKIPARFMNHAEYFSSPPFLQAIVSSFQTVGRLMREEAVALCDYYGERIASALLTGLAEEETASARRFLLDLAVRMGTAVVAEALLRLKDRRWYVLRNMIFILGHTATADEAKELRQFCRHEHRKVAVEAGRALLKLGDPSGVGFTRRLLRSEDEEERKQGLAFAKNYRIREMVPELVAMLQNPSIGAAEVGWKIVVIRTLGEIGDPSAVPVLKKLLSSGGRMFRGHAGKLEEELYASLINYPFHEIRDMVERGLKSQNETIRRVCRQMSASPPIKRQ